MSEQSASYAEPSRPRTPLVVWLLVGAILASYIIFALTPQSSQALAEFEFALDPRRFHADNPLRFHAWYEMLGALVGHAFLHISWWHAGLNAFFLFGTSRLPALRLGAARYLIVFFASVIGGAVVFLAINWNDDIAAIGASGGVCGMFSAYFLSARGTWRQALADPRVRGPFAMLVFINVVVMAAVAETNVFPIAWEGHLGGFLFGALAYIALERPLRGPWA